MVEIVAFSKEGNFGLITVNNPPVNALSQAVRAGIKASIEKGIADKDVTAIIIICDGRTFIAGADIREFGKPPMEPHYGAGDLQHDCSAADSGFVRQPLSGHLFPDLRHCQGTQGRLHGV